MRGFFTSAEKTNSEVDLFVVNALFALGVKVRAAAIWQKRSLSGEGKQTGRWLSNYE